MNTINEGHTSTGGWIRFSVDDESGSLWNGSSHEMQIQRLLRIVLELKQDDRAHLRVEQSLKCTWNHLAIVLSIALTLLYVAHLEKISDSEFGLLLEIIRVLGVFICTNCCQRHVYWRCLRFLKDRNPQSTPGEDQLSPMRDHETPLLNSGNSQAGSNLSNVMGLLRIMFDTLAIGLLLSMTVGFVLVLIGIVSVPFAQLGFLLRESPLLWHEIEIDPTFIGHGCDNLVVHYELSEIRQGQPTRRVVAFNHQVAFYLPAITLAVLLGKDLLVAAFGFWCTRAEEREPPRCKLLKQFVAKFICDHRRGFIATVVVSSMAVSIPAVIQQTECAPWFEFLSLTVFITGFVISFLWLPISRGLLVRFSFLVSLVVVVLLASFGPAPLEVLPYVGGKSESTLVHAPGYFQILRKEHVNLLRTSAVVFPCLPFLALWVYRFPVRLFAHYTTRDLLILGRLDNFFGVILPFSLTQLNLLPVDSTTKGEVVEFMKRASRNRDMESLSPALSPIDDLILGEGSILADVPEDEKVSHVIGLYYLNALQRKVSNRLVSPGLACCNST